VDQREAPAEQDLGGTPILSQDSAGWSTAPDEPREDETRRRGLLSFFAELPVLILIAFVLALLLKTFLVQAFFIPSSSMEPTLQIGDRVLVNKVVHHLREPRRGELLVFTERGEEPLTEPDRNAVARLIESLTAGLGLAPPDERDFIKRVIGLPEETVEIRDGTVYADGVAVPEATLTEGGYLSAEDLTDFGPLEIPAGEYFMLGDNRPQSADSRFTLGTIPEEDVVGRAFVVIWPVDRLARLSIPDYRTATLAPAPAEAGSGS
jgi:signal peptidase I